MIQRLATCRRPRPRRRWFLLAVCIVALVAAAERCQAQAALSDGFEGPDVSLADDGGDANYRIEGHARVSHGAHSGRWCEHVTVRGANGTYVYMAHALGPARVIGELSPSMWVKSDRPGLQLIVRVVLPRSTNPSDGQPLTTLIRGTSYAKVGSWEQLRWTTWCNCSNARYACCGPNLAARSTHARHTSTASCSTSTAGRD